MVEPGLEKRRASAGRLGRACAVLTCAAIFSATCPAIAAPGQQQRAQALFEKGRAAYMKGDFKSAYHDQRSAWELMKTFDIAANLGQAELQLHLYRDAAQHFRYALDHFPASGNAHKKQRLKASFDKARAKVGALALHVQPDGAQVSLDGAAVPAPLPTPLFLEPGSHQIKAELDGYTPQTKSVTAKAGGSDKLDIALEKAAEPAPAPADSTAPPAASSSAPPPSAPPPSADTGEQHGVEPRTVAIIAGAGLTVVALGVGIGFLVDAGSADNNASDLRKQAVQQVGTNGCAANPDAAVCVSLRNANDHASRSRTISTVGFVGAGVLGIATLGAVLFWPKHHDEAQAHKSHGVELSPVVLGASGLGADYPHAGLFSAAGIGVKGHF